MLSALNTENSPFSKQQLRALQSSVGMLDDAQSQWLSGYMAGRLDSSSAPLSAAQPAGQDALRLTILYGSETGNGEAIAQSLAEAASQAGLAANLQALDGFRPAALRKLKHAVFVISTHGEGDPPDEALDLFEYLDSDRAPDLAGLSYRVLALGDRSYSLFCEAGRRLDERLGALGATSFGPRVDCDVDYEGEAETWRREVLEHAREQLGTNAAPPANRLSLVTSSPQWTRQQPFAAELTRVQKITGLESTKDVYHLELSLEGSGMPYQPGDALGVWAPNDPALVDHLLAQTGIAPATPVMLDGREMPVAEALAGHRELTRMTTDTVMGYALAGARTDLVAGFKGLAPDERRAYIEQRQLVDLADEFPATMGAQQLIDILRPLAPRSYSIASSQALVDDEIHLTVATLHSNAIGAERHGVASHFLNHRLGEGGEVRVFLEPNRRFHLPEDQATPLIMIGAGTGIAPYRAFMQEFEARGTTPPTWLIFGNPHLRTDFLYQREWLKWRDAGQLNRIDAAWSRDQDSKHHVQHVVLEQAERIERWLQRGAQIYICGGLAMGQAVHEALEGVLAGQRGLDSDAAAAALADLRRARRLHKDLY